MEPQISPAAIRNTHTIFNLQQWYIYNLYSKQFQSDKFIENWFINFIFEIIIIQHTTV